MAQLNPLGRQDLDRFGKSMQQWLDAVTRQLNESPVVASLSGDTSPVTVANPAAAPAAYSQAHTQQIVDLLTAIHAKQDAALAILGEVLTALAKPIGS